MRASIARRLGIVVCVSVLGLAAAARAGNRLETIQTTSSSCGVYGGGGVIGVSPNGAHVYEITGIGQLQVSSRNAATGELTPVQTIGSNVVPSVSDIAFSPDGKHVYFVGALGVSLFDRDTGSGVLTLVGTTALPVYSYSPGRIELSPDGAHAYVARDDTLRLFARDATTGALTQVDQYTAHIFTDVVVSPDGANVYANAVENFPWGLRAYARDAGTGALTLLGTTPTPNPGRLAVSPDGKNLYLVASLTSVSALLTFARDTGTGLVTQIDVKTYNDPGLSLLRQAWVIMIDPGGTQVYVTASISAGFGGGGILVFDRSNVDGSLTLKEQHVDQAGGVDGLKFIFDAVVTPDGAHVYSIGEGTVAFARDAATGALTFLRDAELEAPSETVIASSDGHRVYRLCARSVAAFDRDGSTGLLTQIGSFTFGPAVDEAVEMWIAPPDGTQVYVRQPGQYLVPGSGALLLFHRDPMTEALTFVNAFTEADLGHYPFAAVTFSPDGKNFYVGKGLLEGLAVLARDPSTGQLTLLQSLDSGIGAVPVDALTDVTDVVVSPDGGHVYVSTFNEQTSVFDGIAAFTRDASTGALTFAGMSTVNGGGGGPFDGILRLALNSGGTLLYASGVPGGLSVYARNATSGTLTARGSLRQGSPYAGVLANPVDLAVKADGTALYTLNASSLQVLRTDPATGALAFVETVPGVSYPRGQAPSPDGSQLYVAGGDGNVTVLGPRTDCAATPASGCVGATSSTLKVGERPGPGDLVTWKWKAPGAIVVGDPLTTTALALCVYDGSSATQPMFSSAILPGRTCGTKPCWAATATGYKYADKVGAPDGIAKIRLLTGGSGTASIALKGKGAGLPPLGLAYATPVTVQLQASNGQCWEATYATATSDAVRFKATQ